MSPDVCERPHVDRAARPAALAFLAREHTEVGPRRARPASGLSASRASPTRRDASPPCSGPPLELLWGISTSGLVLGFPLTAGQQHRGVVRDHRRRSTLACLGLVQLRLRRRGSGDSIRSAGGGGTAGTFASTAPYRARSPRAGGVPGGTRRASSMGRQRGLRRDDRRPLYQTQLTWGGLGSSGPWSRSPRRGRPVPENGVRIQAEPWQVAHSGNSMPCSQRRVISARSASISTSGRALARRRGRKDRAGPGCHGAVSGTGWTTRTTSASPGGRSTGT